MLRPLLVLLPAGLLLSGCVAPPYATSQAAPYYQPGPAQPVAAQPAPAYPYGDPAQPYPTAPPYLMAQPYVGPDGLAYVDGQPVTVIDGEQVAIIHDPGFGWGYYDRFRRFHGAPPALHDRLERFHPGGGGFPPPGGFRGVPGAPPPQAAFRGEPGPFPPGEFRGGPRGPVAQPANLGRAGFGQVPGNVGRAAPPTLPPRRPPPCPPGQRCPP